MKKQPKPIKLLTEIYPIKDNPYGAYQLITNNDNIIKLMKSKSIDINGEISRLDGNGGRTSFNLYFIEAPVFESIKDMNLDDFVYLEPPKPPKKPRKKKKVE